MTARVSSSLAARWSVARATLIAMVIATGLINGCPWPGATQRALLAPVAFIGRGLDISQRWSLFRGASAIRWRLSIEGRDGDGAWRILYRAGDPAHAEYVEQLEYRRIRGTYSPSGQRMRGQYPQFAEWMTARVLDEHPELTAARTRFEQVHIDGGSYTPTGKFEFERARNRRVVTP